MDAHQPGVARANAPAQRDEQPGRTPTISLPKGGGAVRGIGEKFGANPVNGTATMTVPIATSPGRSGFGPQFTLSYDSGSGNGPFGLGWSLSIPAITRKTDKGLPQYRDGVESDTFILSGAEDLVPLLRQDEDGDWAIDDQPSDHHVVRTYRPRIEGLFARIERWTLENGEVYWKSISKDNVTTFYGRTDDSRIVDPADPGRVFSWLICESYDDKGNAIVYAYEPENSERIFENAGGEQVTSVHERNRRTIEPDGDETRHYTNRYLKRVLYGNRTPNRDDVWSATDPTQLSETDWMFEVVFDYGEGHYEYLTEPEDDPTFVAALRKHPDGSQWPARQDPFSSYRAGFEIRTYRLCQRVLMFHHFPAQLDIDDCLVRSTEFAYAASPVATVMTRVSQSGYLRQPDQTRQNRYLKRSLPPLEFEYTRVPDRDALIRQPVEVVGGESLENLPLGIDGSSYQWVDLDAEGLSGILTEHLGSWLYKRNLSANNQVSEHGRDRTVARFAAAERVSSTPSTGLADGRAQFMDLAGDGQVDHVQIEGPVRGFYERTDDRSWSPFQPFVTWPNVDPGDPNLRFVDLTGDGHADILITEHDALTWYPSLAEAGYGQASRTPDVLNDEAGPRLVFADGTNSIYLADMSGDGLTDLVRIRNGEVSYWPNLGYGRFGAKVTMDDAPWFDSDDQFSQTRIRLADIDGSGVTDILYLGRNGVQVYFNQSGNRWDSAVTLPQFAAVDSSTSLQVMDLLGNGTACLVWSSPLPGSRRRPLRYVDLMGGQKPHLLVTTRNNLGAETHAHYAPSTKFYLADRAAGKPWITRLPFPVHVVERVETYDRISHNRFVTRYAYHHGYFDGVEREFRGFGMVEQWDTEEYAALSASDLLPAGENVDSSSHVPPVHTKTWFHTGIYAGRDHVSDFHAGLTPGTTYGEYYREPDLSPEEVREFLLDDSVLPEGLAVEEERQACRTLKGAMLRQEVYANDGTDKEQYPYTVTEQNFAIRMLQGQYGNRHAIFLSHAREVINYHYERSPDDPRIAHKLTLEVDEFGNVLKEAAIGYGRRQADLRLPLPEDQSRQTTPLVTYTENQFTDPVSNPDDYRAPLACETRTYELTGYPRTGSAGRFRPEDLVLPDPDDPEGLRLIHVASELLEYEQIPTGGRQRRLIEHVRTLYRPNDMGIAVNDPQALLELGTIESLALPGESYKLAYTTGLLTGTYQRPLDIVQPPGSPPPENLIPDPASLLGGQATTQAGYVDLDGNWWIPAGRVFFSPGSADTPTQERSHARQHFYLPHRHRSPFHTDAVRTESVVTYDADNLLMIETRDPLGNLVTVGERDAAGARTAEGNDYRVLQPRTVMDPNRNRSEVAFDALGMVVGSALMGKPAPAAPEGDSLAGFETDLSEAVMLDHLTNPLADPHDILRRATTRMVYDLFAYQRTKDQPEPQPAVVYTLVRETHDSEPPPDGGLKIQHSFSYSDGFGREMQKKIRAEPGPVPTRDANNEIVIGADGQPVMTIDDVSPRWVGSGWTVFNNKGKPVRQYEPFFTDTHLFEFDVRIGVSPVLFYDPVERVVATLHPNHTWEKVVFDAWRQATWDVSDTILVTNPETDPDVGDFFRRLPDAAYLPTWHGARQAGALGPQEQSAARKAAIHAETPTIAHADALGRTFLTVAQNAFKYDDAPPDDPPTTSSHRTRVRFDIEGNQREVRDAIEQDGDPRGRLVMRYDYDMLGNRIHQASMEAGERWTLNDVAGKPLYAWDSLNHRFRTAYDRLRRPTDSFLREGIGAEQLVVRTSYGETQPDPESTNLRGQVARIQDQAGVVTTDEYDFKGNLLRSQRQLAQQYDMTLDWSAAVPLEATIFTNRIRYDALNRPTELTSPDDSVIRPTYNDANLLERVDANLRGVRQVDEPVWTPFVTDIDYDAKGQRTRIDYGNGARTTYSYDPLTFRLTRLLTTRNAADFPDDCPDPAPSDWPGCQVQNLHYVYDPVGNITHIHDEAQQTVYFRNKRVEPSAGYTYDAVYRLIEATGREHLGQAGGVPWPHSYNDVPRVNLPHPGDGNAMGRYRERYVYDAAGNMQEMIHRGTDPTHPGWTRAYTYTEASQLELAKRSNRLSTSPLASDPPSSVNQFAYDAHGNLLRMPQLQTMQWDFKDQLRMTQRQQVNGVDLDGQQRNGERTWYTYDASGQRVRKVTERATGGVKDERVYIGGFEVYRRTGVNALVRETLHIMDDQRRVAIVETRTDTPAPQQLIRYQFGNHLGSASLELDERARLISYEEYFPYGSTAYQAVASQTDAPKRYRYTSKERDEESGLYYHKARYYAPWLGRWTSTDPAGLVDGSNLYQYSRNCPTVISDPSGMDPPNPRSFSTFDEYRESSPAPYSTEYLLEQWNAVHPSSSPSGSSLQPRYRNPLPPGGMPQEGEDYGPIILTTEVGRQPGQRRTVESQRQQVPAPTVQPSGYRFEVLVGGPYTRNGEEHPYGHVALRIVTPDSDTVYDYGRYGRTWGTFESQGEGILNVWSDFRSYIQGENATGRTTTGFAIDVTRNQAESAQRHLASLIAERNPTLTRGSMKRYRIAPDYDALISNCTTITLDPIEIALPGFQAGATSFIRGQGMSWAERQAARVRGWPTRLFMPTDLKSYLESSTFRDYLKTQGISPPNVTTYRQRNP